MRDKYRQGFNLIAWERHEAMITLGVTGIMGAGKTTVCNMFHEFGIKIIDADMVAHRLISPFGPMWWALSEYFGQGIIDRDTAEVDRQKLGAIVFGDYFLLQKLNILMHPFIIKEIKYQLRQLHETGARMAVLDAPLLIEVGLHSSVDKVLVVLIEQSNRLVRLQRRDPQLTSQDIIQRSCNQMSQEVKQRYADFVIDNNGNLQKTRKQVNLIFKDLMKKQTKIH